MAQMLSTLASADVVLNVLNQSAPIVSNSLDSVGPDLGPNCLQSIQQTTKVTVGKAFVQNFSKRQLH